jgi:hypothetical protein
MNYVFTPADFTVVTDVKDSDFDYTMPPALIPYYQQLAEAMIDGEPVVHEIKQLIQQYPQSPQLYNLLSLVYDKKGDRLRASKTNEASEALFPHYIYSKVNRAKEYINKELFDELDAYINLHLSLKGHLPHRHIFYSDEFIGYELLAIERLLIDSALEEALARSRAVIALITDLKMRGRFAMEAYNLLLSYLTDDEMEDDTNRFLAELQKYVLAAMEAIEQEQSDDDEDDDDDEFAYFEKPYDRLVQTDKAPFFRHPAAIAQLYKFGYDLPAEVVNTLLALPREDLAHDLSAVLRDAVYRYEYFLQLHVDNDETSFPYHAMNLARTAQLTECVGDMLYLLEQGEELLDYYMGDMTTEGLWQVFYPFCSTAAAQMQHFLFMPGVYSYSKLPVIQAFTQWSLHQPGQAATVRQLYKRLCEWQYAMRDNEMALNCSLCQIITSEIIDAGFTDLEPEVSLLYEHGLIDSFFQEGIDDWRNAFHIARFKPIMEPLMDWNELNEAFAEIFDTDEDE